MIITTKFDIKDRVIINGDSSLVATVQRFSVSSLGTAVEVLWFDSSGAVREHFFFEWQLELAL